MGLTQSVTFSFVSPKNCDRILLPADAPERRYVRISNPLGEDTSVMRTTLIPSLLESLSHNNAHHLPSAALYELGHIYIPKEDPNELPDEPRMIAFGFYGDGDFYKLKGMAEALLADAGITKLSFVADRNNPTFHPGRCADIIARGSMNIGVIGQLHPTAAANYGFDQPVYIAYLPFETIFSIANFKKQYKPMPKHPATSRDLAFVCDAKLEVGRIEEVIRKGAGKLLEGIELFDVYTGDRIEKGKKSVAFRLTFRSPDHTLTGDEIAASVDKLLAALDKQLGIKIRQ